MKRRIQHVDCLVYYLQWTNNFSNQNFVNILKIPGLMYKTEMLERKRKRALRLLSVIIPKIKHNGVNFGRVRIAKGASNLKMGWIKLWTINKIYRKIQKYLADSWQLLINSSILSPGRTPPGPVPQNVVYYPFHQQPATNFCPFFNIILI